MTTVTQQLCIVYLSHMFCNIQSDLKFSSVNISNILNLKLLLSFDTFKENQAFFIHVTFLQVWKKHCTTFSLNHQKY